MPEQPRNKETTYPELLHNRRCRLVVLGIEVRGKWSNEASNFIRMLAKARGRSSPPCLQAATTSALVSRWLALLTHAAEICCLKTSPRARILTETCHPSAISSPLPHQPSCADQSPPSPVAEGLDLYLPYQMHIWRVASKKIVCASRLPSKTALHFWTFLRLKRSGRKQNKKTKLFRHMRCDLLSFEIHLLRIFFPTKGGNKLDQ